MNRRAFLQSTAAMAAPGAAPPNILFLMPDQWRGMDLGATGESQVRTPNLDRLAGEGVLFRSAVANHPVCTPARSILLTGKYAYTTGTAVNDTPLASEETSIAEILAARGYYTGFVGKWHLEGGKRLPGFVPPGPRRQGFEFWAANECHHDYFHQHYFRDDPTPIAMPGYEVFTWTDLAVELLEKARQRRRPFCLYVEYGPPHDPYLVPPGFEGMYDPEKIELRKNWRPVRHSGSKQEIAAYYAAVSCLDREMGRLLGKVDELGFRDNTIVLVTSDHGDLLGSHGSIRKQKPWEESVRVPAILRWPGRIRAGWRPDAVLSHIDMAPTLLSLCGARPSPVMPGFDFAGYLQGRSSRAPEFAHLMIHTRTEDNQFEPWRGLRSRRYKYARNEKGPWLLYDLERDPFEMTNLVEEAAHRGLVKRLDGEVARQMRRMGDRWDVLEHRPYR